MRPAAAIVAVLVLLGVAVAATGFAQPARQVPPPPGDPSPPGPVTDPAAPPAPVPPPETTSPEQAPVAITPSGPSRAAGLPWRGRLVNGVQLAEVSADWLTWDPVLKQ